MTLTNRKLGKRGGVLDFAKIRGDLLRLMKQDQHPEARFTTMVDLYALPATFPGWAEAQKKNLPPDRVAVLEAALQAEFGDRRFVPFIQLHEFESLLYCDLEQLQQRITGSETGIAALKREVRDLEPEQINERAATAPSKRIIRHVPVYEWSKVRVGAPAAAAIGLPMPRKKCPHFGQWISKLEGLAEDPKN